MAPQVVNFAEGVLWKLSFTVVLRFGFVSVDDSKMFLSRLRITGGREAHGGPTRQP